MLTGEALTQAKLRKALYRFPGDGYGDGVFCLNHHIISASKDCELCQGHHIMPIPWTEVK